MKELWKESPKSVKKIGKSEREREREKERERERENTSKCVWPR